MLALALALALTLTDCLVSPVPMITEWREAILANSTLTPILHYGTNFFDQSAWDEIKFASKYPWRHVIITTKETLIHRWDKFWGNDLFPLRRLVLDEGHRLRSSGAANKPSTNSLPSAATILALRLESLNPALKWILSATPLVNSLTDLRWVCRFLERPVWYSRNLPPGTFVNKFEYSEGTHNPNGNVDGLHFESIFLDTADPFRLHDEYGSYVHCTTMAWDKFIAHRLNQSSEIQSRQKERRLTEREQERLKSSQQVAGRHAEEIMRTLMLRRSMVSRIPFETGEPIVNIPVMNVVTTRLGFAGDGSKDLYSFLIDNYSALRSNFSGPTRVDTPGHKFSPRWRYIRLVSLSPLLASASFNTSFSVPDLFEPAKIDKGMPFREKVKGLLTRFNKRFPEWGGEFYRSPISEMSDSALVNAMEFGSPKLGQIRNRLREIVTEKKEKVILWVYWPLSQWFVQVVRTLAESDSDSDLHMETILISVGLVRSITRFQLFRHP